MRTILLLVALALLALTISANVHVSVDVDVASPHHVAHHPAEHEEHNDVMPIVEPAPQPEPEQEGEEIVGSGKPIKHVQDKKKSVHKKTESCGQKAIARAEEWVRRKKPLRQIVVYYWY